MPTTRYTPDTFEQECLCLLYKWMHDNGFENPELPPIYLSFELTPHLEKILEKDEREKKDIVFPIDEVLGLYFAESPENNRTPYIVLYAQGITACARSLGVPTEILRAVVLVHEIGHWISHAVRDKKNGTTWETKWFGCATSEAIEMWAQLFTFWVAQYWKEHQKPMMWYAFNELNQNQSPCYKTYQKFVEEKKEDMFTLLLDIYRYDRFEKETQPLHGKYAQVVGDVLQSGKRIKCIINNVDDTTDRSGIF
jgi:hypothetical protein